MARRRTASAGARRGAEGSTLLDTAERMVGQIEAMVAEVAALRADNDALRGELRDAVSMLERASAALGGEIPRRRRRSVVAAAPAAAGAGRRRAAPAGGTRRARAPQAEKQKLPVDVVRAAVGMIGPATAAELAEYIHKNAGMPVSGRAVRWVAEAAGVTVEEGPDGRRRYRLSG